MKTALIGIDLQKDFLIPTGALYVGRSGDMIVKRMPFFLKRAKSRGIKDLFLTRDAHTETSKEISNEPNFQTTFPPHCMIDTRGEEFIKGIEGTMNKVMTKDDISAFKSEYNRGIIGKIIKGYDRSYVFGVATEFCVERFVTEFDKYIDDNFTYVKEHRIFVIKDMCAHIDKDKAENTFERLAKLPNVIVVSHLS